MKLPVGTHVLIKKPILSSRNVDETVGMYWQPSMDRHNGAISKIDDSPSANVGRHNICDSGWFFHRDWLIVVPPPDGES